MPNLPNKPLLLIDAASPRVFVGLWKGGGWLACATPERPALESIFSGVEQLFYDAKLGLADVGGFVHCEGPGSILGVRLSAMAIRTWRAFPTWARVPVWSFGSLHFAAAAYGAENGSPPPNLISEFRHGRWNLLLAGEDTVMAVDDVVLNDLQEPLVYLRQRKTWQSAPSHAVEWSPDWRNCAHLVETPSLLRPVHEPDVFIAEEAVFQKWSAERHRG
ncbi:hypothetical protein [Cerasicoccus arenae]|uniref:tRNA (Adenosine(37)-N6)-threonylcarbamoyltransferase complex dimerization subunit type 1 TsaB n=1 Tax=Cerasicoccus arenae TaxID=424488 RepID=A0A8J3DG81_9BACT|nr:hypothetical protein [Cerasicoccus arenae]MBK1859134.1 hypothetical protein [Cerasicoccus arenae]GHB98038.1 hypothetical protein GCM10007047_12510 [Cerasicoccus arenae]